MTNLIYWPITPPWLPMLGGLFHFEDAVGATTFLDSSSKQRASMTSNGSGRCNISNAQAQFGSSSMHVFGPADGGGGNFAFDSSVPASATFGLNPYTIEYWVRPDNLSAVNPGGNKIQCDFRDSNGADKWYPTIGTWFSRGQGPGDLGVLINGALRITAVGALTAATWQNICLCRTYNKAADSLITRLFVNGTQVGSDFTDNNNYAQPTQINFGCAYPFSDSCLGFFDELRVTNGTGWYGPNYTVATAPFINQ